MSLNVAFQMDHIDTLSIGGDTTFALCLEAQKRGTILEIFGNRKISICRELTKKFEEVITSKITEVIKKTTSSEGKESHKVDFDYFLSKIWWAKL